MVADYLQRTQLAQHDVRFVFSQGDKVLLRQREPGKMKCWSVGPYTFLRYTGRLGVNAVILNARGKEYHASAANLVPVHPQERRMERFVPPLPVPSPSGTTIPGLIPSGQGSLPSGAVIHPPWA